MYVKLFARITESSLMEEEIAVRYTFVMLLALADPTGLVVGTDIAIARRLNMPLEQFAKCAQALQAPDDDSNSKESEGRRIIPSEAERGYQIVNYCKYRDLQSEDERRTYMRDYMRSYRDGKPSVNSGKLSVNNVKPGKQQLAKLTQADAASEAEEDPLIGEVSPHVTNGESRVTEVATLARIALHYLNERAGTKFREVPGHLTLIMARLKSPGVTIEGVKQMIDRQAALWKGKEQEQYLRPSTLFGKMKFDGYYDARECSVPRSPTEIQGLQKEKRQLEDEISVRTVEESQPQRTRLAEVKRQLAL